MIKKSDMLFNRNFMGQKRLRFNLGRLWIFGRAGTYFRLILFCFLFSAPIFSCTQSDTSSIALKGNNENILRIDVNYPLTSLNPADLQASGSNYVFPFLYSYLFVPDDKGNLEPDLATRWTYNSSDYTWTIHIRDDARFHNSKDVTAEDVIYSLREFINNIRPDLDPSIKKDILLNMTSLSICLKKDDPNFLFKIWDMEIIPHPKKVQNDYLNTPIGSGPFRYKSRNENSTVVLEVNEDYYQGRSPLDGVTFYYEPDKEKSWIRLIAGKTDIIQEISPKNYQISKQYQDRFYFSLTIQPLYTILLYNTKDPLFSDIRVRKALSYAINRENIVQNILKGLGEVAVGPMGLSSPYHDPRRKPIPYNPQEGQKLLKVAGWEYDHKNGYYYKGGKLFTFKILIAKEKQIEKLVAKYIKLCLNDLGIQVQLQQVPYQELFQSYFRNTEFQAVLTEFWSPYLGREWIEYVADVWSPVISKHSMAGCFEDERVTSLSREMVNRKEKLLFPKLDVAIVSLQPGTFLFHKTAINLISKRFALSLPFSLALPGLYRLKNASLVRDK